MNNHEILIVGQGLAGTILSYLLFKRGVAHKVLDNNHKNAATHAAAGIVNPITGRRYAKSWMIDELLISSKSFYSDIQSYLKIDILKETSIRRAIYNAGQENKWLSSIGRPTYDKYTLESTDLGDYRNFVTQRMAYGKIIKALQVNISHMISSYRNHLLELNMLITKDLDINNLEWNNEPIKIDSYTFNKVIFCEGYRVIENPLFNYMPFEHSKGESFTIRIDGLKTDEILRDDIFLAPYKESKFWSGGGYKWEFDNDQITKEFVELWKTKLNNLLKVPYTILEHRAGVRSAVKDRRPIIGVHNQYKNVFLFNGMGTKGTSLAPYWADHFLDFLLTGKDLDPEVNLERFKL